jgi:uncharacterized 2Fe-2S/4Fe-4S cluster protein (DUF4445 family)
MKPVQTPNPPSAKQVNETCHVVFFPDEKSVIVEKGMNLLEAAGLAGVPINSVCGGDGVCGKCKVRVTQGTVGKTSSSLSALSKEELQQGYVLACQTHVEDDLQVEIPPESHLDGDQILTEAADSRYTETAFLETPSETGTDVFSHNPLTSKVYLELPPPSLEDNLPDLDRIYRELRKKWDIPILDAELESFRGLAPLLRESGWKVTLTLGKISQGVRILEVEGGDTSRENFGVAVDVGTTTVVLQLVDLTSGRVMATCSSLNPQIQYGEDVISRMIHACGKTNDLGSLNRVVVKNIDELIDQCTEKEGISRENVTAMVAAGNSTMTHFLLRSDPCFIRLEPYVPAAGIYPVVKASEVGVHIRSSGLLACMPSVSSYVGGDITAGVLASGIQDSAEVSMLLDVGTNGEIVMGNNEWLVCCSASAGPAFEGGGTECGMRAVKGAIESVTVTDQQVDVLTIGGDKPRGICGSGFIDTVATLFEHDIIHPNGKFNMDHPHPQIKRTAEGTQFVLASADVSATGEDIVITEYDISSLIKSKAAVYAAAHVLVQSVSMDFSDISRIFVAGGFGNYLKIDKAIIMGLLPDLPPDRFQFIGNSSLAGARTALLSNHAFQKAQTLAKGMTYFELSVSHEFMDEFVAGLFLPHTNQELFPTIAQRTRSPGRAVEN